MRAWKLALAGACSALLIAQLCAVTPYDASIVPAIHPLEFPPNRGAAALWQSLNKLRTRASLIMITAHPDDEDGGMLTYESRGIGARVSLLTLNRGEGGANVMSSDYWDALGLVRTQELLAAGTYYGADQYFTRVCDYGFSKTLAEAEAKWTDDRVLADVVRIVRMTRPLVITSVFVGGASDGHGNHQMAGLMAKEVFEAAGDPARFSDQIKAGLKPWTPLKYYARVPFETESRAEFSETVAIPTGTYDPLLGENYLQLSREGLGQQKTQNGGPFIPRAGAFASPYHRFASRVPAADHENTLFDGIDVTLAGIATLAGMQEHSFLTAGLAQIDRAVAQAISAFSAEHPDRCAPFLADGSRATNELVRRVESSNLSDEAKYDILHELNVKKAQFNNALVEALGVTLRATVHPDRENPLFALFMGDSDTFRMAIPGQDFSVQVTAANQSSSPLTLRSIALRSPHSKQLDIRATAPGPQELAPDQNGAWRFAVHVHNNATYTRPYFTRPSIQQPYYNLLNPSDAGLPLSPYPLSAWVELAYQNVPIQIGQVIQTVQHVTGRGVVYEPLAIAPAISLRLAAQRGIVPLAAQSFALPVTLHSNVKGPAQGNLRLDLPIGWQSTPDRTAFKTERDGEDQTITFTVRPANLASKDYSIHAVAEYNGNTYHSGYTVTGYSGVLPYFLYREAEYRLTGTDVKLAPGLKIGYITGTGDDVPQALTELNVHVSYLSSSELATGNLAAYDEILLGVRAYAARPELATYNGRLLDYVKNGGVLVVQYNTPEFDHNFGPYPYKMGEDPEEVTDEASTVQLLDPSNPVFQWPNRITQEDFRNWVEERGSKFLTTWDPRYTALLETHDPSQAPQRGGLLYAKYGKGIYIYNAYALYRELPEGVPGAFRLMANLLSLPKNPNR